MAPLHSSLGDRAKLYLKNNKKNKNTKYVHTYSDHSGIKLKSTIEENLENPQIPENETTLLRGRKNHTVTLENSLATS